MTWDDSRQSVREMGSGLARVIVGRTEEVGVLDGLLADPLSEPRALLIEGEPGIGKSTLLQELLAIAHDRQYSILLCRPTRSEMDLSYVGLVELLEGRRRGASSTPCPLRRPASCG